MGGWKAALVTAVRLEGEVAILQLSVCLDINFGLGNEDKVEALGAMIGCKVEVVHRAKFCTLDGCLIIRIIKFSCNPGICGLCLIDTKETDNETRKAFLVNLGDSRTEPC